MEQKHKTLALLFAMAFIATSIFIVFMNTGIEGNAVKEFSSLKEKNIYCSESCDEKMNSENEFSSWIACHEECMK
ncbi:MAG: hypothetical protein ABH986_03345 [archaeon]